MTTPAAGWLAVDDVKRWLRLTDAVDDAILADVCLSVQPWVERCRPEWSNTDEATGDLVYTPDPETYRGAVMFAAKVFRRRNSPGGIESFADNLSFVARWDPEVARFLRTGDYMTPAVG